MNAPAIAFYDEEDRFFELNVRPLLRQAKDELKDEFLNGKRIQNYDLEVILDEMCQNENYHDFLQRVAQAICTNDIYWLRRYVETCVEDFVNDTPDLVESRAYWLAQAEEDMSKQRTNDANE